VTYGICELCGIGETPCYPCSPPYNERVADDSLLVELATGDFELAYTTHMYDEEIAEDSLLVERAADDYDIRDMYGQEEVDMIWKA
jgi:hypothetical protein